MIYYKNYQIPNLIPVTGSTYKDGKKVSVMYYKDRLSLDTETSSWFFVDNEWNTAKYLSYEQIKNATATHSSVYIWQFGINDEIVYGRTIEELKEFMDAFNQANPMRKILYIQNLGYDFAFISEKLEPGEGMYAAPYKPYYYLTGDNWELRDLLMLTGYNLATLAKVYGITNKLTGDLDYTDNITHLTKLTDKELAYCAVDIEIIQEYLKTLYSQYDPLKVPMTSTGCIRRTVRKIMNKYKAQMIMIRPDFDLFDWLTKTYCGGVTHCSNLYTAQIILDVYSDDRGSSYPAECVCGDHFPQGEFLWTDPKKFNINEMNKCTIMRVTFKNIMCKSSWQYLSAHKAYHLDAELVDNGRLHAAKEATYYLTDIDFRIVVAGYDMESYEIEEMYQTDAGYLPREFVDFVLENYEKKTTLKGIPEREDEYRKAKGIINGLYGMMVTSPVHPEILFDIKSGEWTERDLDMPEMSQILEEDKPFLYFAWGVYVTAMARYELFCPLYGLDNIPGILDDCAYCDTDSLKYVNNHDDSIDAYNARMMKRIEKAAQHFNFKIERYCPLDSKGKAHPIGMFEHEGKYDKFLSLGAKKYCYEQNGEFHFVVAGLKKSYVDTTGKHPTMTSMNEMFEGSVIPHARTSSLYNCDMQPCEVIDRDGNSCFLTNKRGIVMYNSPYTFGLSDDYDAFLTMIRASGKLNGPVDIIRQQLNDVIKERKHRDKK